jgi:transposase InsO family protein
MPLGFATLRLGVSRSGYYKWCRRRERRDSTGDDVKVREEIQAIAVDFPRYGYRRITWELRNRGLCVNGKRVLRLMRLDNLLCVRKKFRPCTTLSCHCEKVYPNLAGDMVVSGINQLWVSDITYIQLEKEFVYLAVVLDVYSRRCIGWELSSRIDTRLTMGALQEALKTRRMDDLKGLVHHSDQGVQYACHEYVECLQSHGIRVSMSRRGNPYDNAFAESFMKTLKYEEVYLNEYQSFKDAVDNIERFIEQVYNQKRLHSSIGYKSPVEFEKTISINNVS